MFDGLFIYALSADCCDSTRNNADAGLVLIDGN